MKFSALTTTLGAFFATATTAFAQFNSNATQPVNNGLEEIIINTRDEAYEPWGLKMKKGDTLAIDLAVLKNNKAHFGPTVKSAGACGLPDLPFLEDYKEVKGFKLAETLLTIKGRDNQQEIVSLCDAVSNAPKSRDGRTAYLIADDKQTIINAFVNEGRHVVNSFFSGSKRAIDDNNGKIKVAYQHLKHK